MTEPPEDEPRNSPRSKRCPWCNSAPGQPCTVPSTPGKKLPRRREVNWYHTARWEAAAGEGH